MCEKLREEMDNAARKKSTLWSVRPYLCQRVLVLRYCRVVTWRSRCGYREWDKPASHTAQDRAAPIPTTEKPCTHRHTMHTHTIR